MTSPDLAQRLLDRAYTLEAPALDGVAVALGARDWAELVAGLDFRLADTGGGCEMLLARTRSGAWIGLTDGGERAPTTPEAFWLGVMPEPGEVEDFYVFVREGRVASRGGERVSAN